jgi:hypothetical protein
MSNNKKIVPKSLTEAYNKSDFSPNLVGFQITNGTPLFTFGNFEITSNLEERFVKNYSLGQFSKPITIETINLDDKSLEVESNNLKIFLNYDRKNLKNYAYFGSLKEFIRVEIEDIIQKYPSSLVVSSQIDGQIKITVLNNVYNSLSNTSTFNIPVSSFVNPFEMSYTQEDVLINTYAESNDLRNISANFLNYEISFPPFDSGFKILEFTGSTTINSGSLTVVCEGNPFSGNTSLSITYHIKPNQEQIDNFFNSITYFQSYLLNRNTSPLYTSTFSVIEEDDETGQNTFTERSFTWPVSDGYNIDINTAFYLNYLDDLNNLAITYDQYKTDLISRFLTPSVLKEFDTPNLKFDKMLRVYGRELDEIKLFIDSIAFSSTIQYNKDLENLPDLLVKNFAKVLGWDVLQSVNETDLLKFFVNSGDSPVYGNNKTYLTPAEMDIELWRRLILNSSWLWKSKGTRKALEFLFRFIGAPDCLVDFNEHVYTVDSAIDYNTLKTNLILSSGITINMNDYPISEDGFPNKIQNSPDYYFQMNGGWFEENVYHEGEYDFGQTYLNRFRDIGFKLTFTEDNKKSWPYTGGTVNRFYDLELRETNYNEVRSELIINTKEVSLYLDPALAIECDVFNFYKSNYPLCNISKYPTWGYDKSISAMTFSEFIKLSYERFIDARTRKTVSYYPTLRMIYEDYLNSLEKCGINSKGLTYQIMNKYIDLIDSYWFGLIQQFIPATTIWKGGEKYRNTIFDRQKFQYKKGIDYGSEFAKEQTPELVGEMGTVEIDSKLVQSNVGEIDGLLTTCGFWKVGHSLIMDDNCVLNIQQVTLNNQKSGSVGSQIIFQQQPSKSIISNILTPLNYGITTRIPVTGTVLTTQLITINWIDILNNKKKKFQDNEFVEFQDNQIYNFQN